MFFFILNNPYVAIIGDIKESKKYHICCSFIELLLYWQICEKLPKGMAKT